MQPIERLVEAMGGRNVFGTPPVTENDLARLIRAGLPVGALMNVACRFQLSSYQQAKALGISTSTIRRLHRRQTLNPNVSDRLFKLASVGVHAADTLGTYGKAARWLHRKNQALSGDSPLDRLDTSVGIHQVEAILHHIEDGFP